MLTPLSTASPVSASVSHGQRGIENVKMLQWCLTLAPLGNRNVFVERVRDQHVSPSICLLSHWVGQLLMPQLHAGIRSLICLCAGYHGDLHFISLQKAISPDYGLCRCEDEATP